MPISTTDVPEERKFQRQLDPHGRLDYTVDWTNVLGNETIESVTTTLSPMAVAAGVEILDQTNDTTTATVRIGVEEADRDDPQFDPPGTEFAFKQTVEDSTGQIHEFSYTVRVVQQ